MKTIRLKIKKDGSVHVSADTSVSIAVIEEFMLKKIDWIIEHTSTPSPPAVELALTDGRMLRLFGEKLRLSITKSPQNSGETLPQEMRIRATDPSDSALVERLVSEQIAVIARSRLQELVDLYLDKAAYCGKPPTLTLKLLQSKWGHFSVKKHEIMLNLALCGLPYELIQYTVAHEVTHLFVQSHSKDFYQFGETLLPNFKRLDRQLNGYSTAFWANVLE